MDDPVKYSSARMARVSALTSGDPDFIGAEAALKRASTKAIERARHAGLQPVIMNPDDISTEAVLREDPAPYRIARSKKRTD
jgi:hypothetical protein